MTADRFASTAADILLGCDHATGRKLMRTAVRLLAHGRPATLADLAAAAGVEVDLRNAPAGQDIEYDDQHRIIGWGVDPQPNPAQLYRRRAASVYMVRRRHAAIPGDLG